MGAGQRSFPLADQMSDDEGPEISPTSMGHDGTEKLSESQQAQQLVNCLMVWRFESGEVQDEPQAEEDREMAHSEQQE